MLWQYKSDTTGAGIKAAAQPLVTAYAAAGYTILAPQLSEPAAPVPVIRAPNSKVTYPIRLSWINSLEWQSA